jgi:1-acyl-sn-glycerol-3-phosphate acyltransferase
VGLFPEGGIRDGARSLLEGAPLRPGAATLAQIADVPVVPCVILGTDRFYSKKQWLPFRRTPVWIAFGKPISCFPELQKSQARERIESELAAAFKNLYAELREKFRLTTDDLPRSPQERSGVRQDAAASQTADTSVRSKVRRVRTTPVDLLLCASINWLHRRHPLNGHSRQEMERYLTACERLSPQEYYVPPQAIGSNGAPIQSRREWHARFRYGNTVVAQPDRNSFCSKQHRALDFFRTDARTWTGAPTVFLLHALMSSSPTGYYRWAEKFNELGLERVFRSFAIPLFACPHWLLEWRTGDHTGSDSERGRTASGRNRTAANNGIIAGPRLP